MLEPKSGREVGVWFEDDSCWGYKGTLPVVMEVENLLDLYTPRLRSFHVSRCPACSRSSYEHKRVVRWIILPK